MKKSLSILLALCLALSIFAGSAAYADEAEKPVVYFTDDISPEGLVAVYKALLKRIDELQGLHTLEHAEEIGFGSRAYTLVDIGKGTA